VIQHKFKQYCINRAELFANMKDKDGEFVRAKCNVATFMRAVCKQADTEDVQVRLKGISYVGDGFECFVEAMIGALGYHHHIGVTNYKPVGNNDMGVDGYGIGLDGKNATVQVKYRPDSTQLLTASEDNLNSFVVESVLFDRELVNPENDRNMLIVTTAKGLHPTTATMKFRDRVRCMGIAQINDLTKGNVPFWQKFEQEFA
jgi:hypothetical protein